MSVNLDKLRAEVAPVFNGVARVEVSVPACGLVITDGFTQGYLYARTGYSGQPVYTYLVYTIPKGDLLKPHTGMGNVLVSNDKWSPDVLQIVEKMLLAFKNHFSTLKNQLGIRAIVSTAPQFEKAHPRYKLEWYNPASRVGAKGLGSAILYDAGGLSLAVCWGSKYEASISFGEWVFRLDSSWLPAGYNLRDLLTHLRLLLAYHGLLE